MILQNRRHTKSEVSAGPIKRAIKWEGTYGDIPAPILQSAPLAQVTSRMQKVYIPYAHAPTWRPVVVHTRGTPSAGHTLTGAPTACPCAPPGCFSPPYLLSAKAVQGLWWATLEKSKRTSSGGGLRSSTRQATAAHTQIHREVSQGNQRKAGGGALLRKRGAGRTSSKGDFSSTHADSHKCFTGQPAQSRGGRGAGLVGAPIEKSVLLRTKKKLAG